VNPSLTDTLCTRCGLCCDGSLFADVELGSRAEITRLEVLGLVIDDDDASGALLPQPCRALDGTLCSIYAHRPKCCRTFECGLLKDVRRGAVSVEWAGEQITQTLHEIAGVHDLLAQLGRESARLPLKERCAEALARSPGADPRRKRKQEELEAAWSAVESQIGTVFLGHRVKRAEKRG